MKNRSNVKHTRPQPLLRRSCALVLAMTTAFSPALSSAAVFPGLIGRTALPFVPPAGMLPMLMPGFLPSGASVTTNGSLMTITQNQGKDKVIIDWSSFNIGSGALVRFNQGTGTPGSTDWKPNSNYAALNRIYDLDPNFLLKGSVINGNLIADGRVYLINRNGVFFGPQGKVQVQSLVASAFNLSKDDFTNGLLRFNDTWDWNSGPVPTTPASISNEGAITTYSGGSVFFVGPHVQNLGTISAPAGKIDLVGLMADGQVEIKEIQATRDNASDVVYTDPVKAGYVANMREGKQEGKLVGEDGGWIGLYGGTVRNDGMIRAVTTRRQNGVIILAARDLAATGDGSETNIEVSDSSEAMGRIAQLFTPGLIYFTALQGAAAPGYVDHEGSITAPSGEVKMEATTRVFLGAKSNIDVSGLNIQRPMSDQFIEAQLNSLYLRDDYGQKYGTLLPGSTVTVDVLKGSAIGNLSGYYLGMPKTARDLSTVGGTINIGIPMSVTTQTLGETILSTGARLNLSGGSVTYSGAAPASTKLIGADGRVYDISSAPQWLTYSGILGITVKSYGKFGNEQLKGISFGGQLIPLKLNNADKVDRAVGGNAGSLTLRSRVIEGLNDGLKLQADVTTGFNQTVTTPHLDSDKNALTDSPEYQRYLNYLVSQNRGLEAPTGGKLVVGNTVSTDLSSAVAVQQDAGINSVAVKTSASSAVSVTNVNDAPLSKNTLTEISAEMINRANLSTLEINGNTSITTDKDANITLRPGGSYIARGRRIEFLGSITTPGGSVEMSTQPNITSYVPTTGTNPLYDGTISEAIYLGGNSRISTVGEQIDNSQFALFPLAVRKGGFTNGGSISLLQLSATDADTVSKSPVNENSVIVSRGALLDVSGGYLSDTKGAVSGGNAGTLKVQAHTISLGGDVRGFSLPGKNGGEIILHAQNVQVVGPGQGINDTFTAGFQAGKLVLGADRFKDTGFSRISLNANDNLTIESGVVLTPSLMKSAQPPVATTVAGATCVAGACFSSAYPNPQDQIGNTSITLNAGKSVYGSKFFDSKLNVIEDNPAAKMTISTGATVATEAGGTITLSAPLIDIAGTVTALGGSVKATANNGDLQIENTGLIRAGGYYKTGIAMNPGQPAPLPVPVAGGTVTLEALTGALKLDGTVDVSSPDPDKGQGYVRDANGQLTPVSVVGDAGTLTLAYGTNLLLNGTIDGHGQAAGSLGGSLTVRKNANDLTLNAADVNKYQASGFDALTFSSLQRILIPANINLSVKRSLTLNSQLIQGAGAAGDARVNAPWITLDGIVTNTVPGASIDTTGGTISFNSTYLDVKGGLLLEGFKKVDLIAERDLTFDETFYGTASLTGTWNGYLKTTAADLTLTADRIYPTTASAFSITTHGKATISSIKPGVHDTAPIYSAGGNLTISADGDIQHSGFLAAPLGGITLYSNAGRVELSGDSVSTTAGSAPVPYGTYDSSKWWSKYVNNTGTGEVTAAPAKSITLKGSEVVVRDGAVQDLSGGGSVYASYWQSGIPGSNNPLTIAGRYVILPDGSAMRPGMSANSGQSVHLDAMPSLGLKAGFYLLLPAEYAFVPGALVIQDTGKQLLAGQQTVSKEKYPVVGGYTTFGDAPVSSQVYRGFSVRRASDVLKEGDFAVKNFSGGYGGNFTLTATGGAYYGGLLHVDPLAGYKGGIATFVAKNVDIVKSVAAPDFSQPLSDSLQLSGDKLSTLPVSLLQVGDKETTTAVTVQNAVTLEAAAVTLSAASAVTLKDGSKVEATGSGATDVASIVTGGTFTLGDGAQLKAKGGIKLDVNAYTLSDSGVLDTGGAGNFSLTAGLITMDDASKNFWEKLFTNNGDVSIASRSSMDLHFSKDEALKTNRTLTLGAAHYTGTGNITFESQKITLLNSGATSTQSPSAASGTVGFKADSVTVEPRQDGANGNIAFDQSVNINSKNDLVFKGAGSITTAGDITLSASRVTTSGDYKADGSYTAANITIDGRKGAVTLNESLQGGAAGTTSVPGGSLQILGNTITQNSGVLEVAAGQVGLTAKSDITIKGAIKATGSEKNAASGEKVYYNGGRISLRSDGGKVDLQSGSGLDVSAAVVTDNKGKIVTDANGVVARKGDAGAIVLSATAANKGGVVAAARFAGIAGSGGKGGSFDIDSAGASATTGGLDGVGGLNGLSSTLRSGGFTNLISIRSRAGDVELSNGNMLTGREVVIAADASTKPDGTKNSDGSIVISGDINADTADGSGRIELYAGKKLTIEGNSVLSARGIDSGAHGGSVILSSQDGSDNENIDKAKTFNGDFALNIYGGINVSGNGSGTGGKVAFRAYQGKQTGGPALNDVNIGSIGTINGASRVSVEAVRAYTSTTGNVGTLVAARGYGKEAYDFFSPATTDAIKIRLPNAHLQAGIEISTAAGKNLTVDKTLDLSAMRPGGEAVVLTLKSGGDLLVNQKMTDARTAIATLHSNSNIPGDSTTMQDTTAFNLVAGSDGGVNYMGVAKGSALNDGTGDLTIAGGKWVYTENAPIRFAAGRDATFGGTSTGPNTMINADMKYNLGSYGGSVRGDVGRDLLLTFVGSAIQTALGDIDIRTGRDINLGTNVNTGAIRTTGEHTPGNTEIAPGLNAFLELPELAGLLNPDYTPTNGKSIINPAYTNPFNLGTTGVDKTLQDLAALIYANHGSNIGAANKLATAASYWTYNNGGSIRLAAGRSVAGNLNPDNGWDGAYIDANYFLKAPKYADKLTPWYLTAGFGGSKERKDFNSYFVKNIPVTVGIATMGGGNVTVTAGGSLLTQVGSFRTGNVAVTTGADMSGRFRIMDGSGTLTSGGVFGTAATPVVTEMAAARVRAVAMGDVHLGTVQNPDNTRDHIFFGPSSSNYNKYQKFWNMTYSPESSFSAVSLAGNATLYGTNPYYAYSAYSVATLGLDRREYILPAAFKLAAAGDIDIMTQFVLAPSQTGNLGLFAGGGIRGDTDNYNALKSGFSMQDVTINEMYGRKLEYANINYDKLAGEVHYGINHLGDTTTVQVAAGKDITDLILKLNKPAEVSAGGDITKLVYVGQNLTADSVTSIKAGGNIEQGITIGPLDQYGNLKPLTPNIEIGGPGTLLVQAGTNLVQAVGAITEQVGGNIRLGNSGGINSVGNQHNAAFSGSGKYSDSDLIVVAGANNGAFTTKAPVQEDVQAFFATLKAASDSISQLKADGKTAEADKLLAETEQRIRTYFYKYIKDPKDPQIQALYDGIGTIDLVDSAISSRSGSIYAMAGSNLNVGRSALSNAPMKTSGLTTLDGGELSVYAGNDVNVNESRLMTYMGGIAPMGDITVWSDQGDINAGRGSKTVVSAPTKIFNWDPKNPGVLLSISLTPPSAGSGIRALTYDPDGSGPLAAPKAGDIHIYAKGTLDAGEAGIQGNKLLVAASAVLNSQNITAGVTTVGVPVSNQNTVSIGPMTGNTDMTATSKMIENISGAGEEAARNTALAEVDDFLMKYLDVKVIELEEGTL